MSKEISFSNICAQCCNTKHSASRDHTFIELRRFKNKLTEFLSIDDEHWLPAFEIDHQLDQLMTTIQKLKNELDNKIVEKRLMYALNLQTDKKVLNIFKMANQDRFEELSCEDVAVIKNRIDKNRNPKASQIQNLINKLMKEQKLKLIEQISQSFARFKDNEESELLSKNKHVPPKSQEFYPGEKLQRIQRERRVTGRREQLSEKKKRSNDLPTIKVDEIEATDSHFNIILKVIKVKKEFTLGDKRKIEFEGGDETGQAIVVVDSLRMIKAEAVIKINNAKVYSFHGVKQIQQNLKYSLLEEVDRDLKVSDNYYFSITKSRRQPREQKELREPRDREQRQQRRVGRHRQIREVNQERQMDGRKNRIDRADRQDRTDKRQLENVYKSRREQQPRQTRNRDQNQRIDISRQKRKRQIPKRQQKSGQYSDDEAEDSDEDQVIKKASQTKKIEIKPTSKTLTKIKDIEPQMESISLMAEIVSIGKSTKDEKVGVSKNSIFAVLGDETGTIWAELPQNIPYIRENSVIHLQQIEVQVHQTQCKLILRLNEDSEVSKTTMRMPKINLQNDMSQQRWEQQPQQEDQESKQIVQDF